MDRAKKGDARLKWLSDVANRMAKWWSDTDI
jgi:hypothetical protein